MTCPLGPRVRSFVGRRNSVVPAPEGRLPRVTDSAEELVALFADKTIRVGELVALVGAHTTSRQRFVDPSRAGEPQDTTPGVWDVVFYKETISRRPPPCVFRFQSDLALAHYPPANDYWTAFADPGHGPAAWTEVGASLPC